MAPACETVERNSMISGMALHDGLDACRIDVNAADIHHVVGSGKNSAFEARPGPSANTRFRNASQRYPGAVANNGTGCAAKVGDDKFSALSIRHRRASGVEDFADEFRFVQVEESRVFPTFET